MVYERGDLCNGLFPKHRWAGGCGGAEFRHGGALDRAADQRKL